MSSLLAATSMPMDVPLIGARAALWIVAQVHLYFAAFVLGAPIFIVICEWLGQRRRDPRYERLAKETMKVVTIAYSFTALLGAGFAFLLMGPYHALGTYLLQQMGAVFALASGAADVAAAPPGAVAAGLTITFAVAAALVLAALILAVGIIRRTARGL